MTERRYRDDEIAEIFEAAAAAARERRLGAGPAAGLTLSDLQAIGREVGIAPDRIAEAAAALEHDRAAPARSLFRLPLSVRKVVTLPRAPTDQEWELLVGELRTTFEAAGKDGSRGNLRQWTNGNLHAFIEPTEAGARLRLGTTKGNAIALNWLGISWIVTAGFLAITGAGGSDADVGEALLFGAMGVAMFIANTLRLPRWASTRERQMDHIASRAREILAESRNDERAPLPGALI